MVRHAQETGWTPLAPEIAKQKRGGEAGMLLRDELKAKLARFNPRLTGDAIHAIIETLDAVPPTIEGNREMLAWLRGEKAWHDETEKRHRRVTLIDFEHTDANAFHVSWEWVLKPPARKSNRADVMFLVNGLPVCIVEHKNPKDGDAIERGITQLRRYEKETPELIGAPQLFCSGKPMHFCSDVGTNDIRRQGAARNGYDGRRRDHSHWPRNNSASKKSVGAAKPVANSSGTAPTGGEPSIIISVSPATPMSATKRHARRRTA